MVKKLQGLLWAIGMVSGMAASAAAQELPSPGSPVLREGDSPVETLRERPQPATTVKDWVAQIEAVTVQVTAVKLERSETGLDIVLETAEGKPLQVDATKFRAEGNRLIAEIPNAVLALPEGQAFSAENPTADIASVQVAQQDVNTIRVSVAGTSAPPTTEVTLKTGGLAYSLNPAADEPDEEIVVTGEGQRGYRVPNASVGTRTDTPTRDVPFSVQVLPRDLLRDQNVTSINDALKNVPGAVPTLIPSFNNASFNIRGFRTGNFVNLSPNSDILKDGIADPTNLFGVQFTNIERIEVLKGPASVLFGRGTPGGTINLITKQPLSIPLYEVEATVGSFDFYRGAIDFSGPLNESKTVLYRLNASYQDSGSFVDFLENRNILVAPVISFALSDRTKLTLDFEYQEARTDGFSTGLPLVGTILSNPNGKIPRSRNVGEPYFFSDTKIISAGYNFEHKFSDDWSIRNVFRASFYDLDEIRNSVSRLGSDNRTVSRDIFDTITYYNAYTLVTDVTGKFNTGSVEHKLLFGFDLSRVDNTRTFFGDGTIPPLDIFNPIYNQPFSIIPGGGEFRFDQASLTDSLGIYVQDQIKLTENLKLLLGARFDTYKQTDRDFVSNDSFSQSGSNLSPRFGLVYQPIQPISLYASYSESFTPVISGVFSNRADGSPFKPERGRQYEVGIKADLSNKLSATLAFFDLTRSNVLTDDPNDSRFSIQTGEQNSQGIELNVSGEILPGWNIYGGYTYTNARLTSDTTFPVGNRLQTSPQNAFSLWTSYELQKGDLKGLGFGLGFFYVGDRAGDLANSFMIPSYFRTDASIFYKQDRLRISLNFRNLFNIDYFETAQNRNRIVPGAPFEVQGTISWRF